MGQFPEQWISEVLLQFCPLLLVHLINRNYWYNKKKMPKGTIAGFFDTYLVAVFLGCTSTGRVGLWFLWFYVRELPKAQPAVVLVLKRLRRRGNGLKSHPTDWEQPGIEPATPGLQDIGLSPTPRRLLISDKDNYQYYQNTTKGFEFTDANFKIKA